MLPRLQFRCRALLSFLLVCLCIYLFDPYDNPAILFLRWHGGKVRYHTKSVFLPSGYPQHTRDVLCNITSDDIGLIIKTGYATKSRLESKLRVIDGRWKNENVAIASDYGSYGEMRMNDQAVQVHDVLAGLIEEVEDQSPVRVRLYKKFKKAIKYQSSMPQEDILKSGWELDIMKHIPALELGLEQLPDKKWYLMIDDDTYIHIPSIISILSTLSPSKLHYLGKALGSYTLRFAHGGSGVVFSHAALAHIFQPKHVPLLDQLKLKSLTSEVELGDKLIGELAMGTGIYLNEEYSTHFNGESPWRSKVTKESVCSEVVGFHGLEVEQMGKVKEGLSAVQSVVRWCDLGGLFGGGEFEIENNKTRDGALTAVRQGWDFVGQVGEQPIILEGGDAKDCEKTCAEREECLSWKSEAQKCWAVPWATGGEKTGDKIVSGLRYERLNHLIQSCVP
ncbi:uncharacterized protein LY89DRAFT_380729 [Mollisia scopiformis]|uniref:N-acetylgalactosaminide beta-1,3-galactosyltransferase n=1 Tax=Mollisia scopiformis TaxID=149040 RepID=A0A194XNH4_MOLSC|nr:uncharacterized protein LY89DRAFT_380729 [Mollisia scopiformis]KUJ21701.1 hypothetical protein LY89DRAFT_380729 [Mollisia scopiformis]